MCEKMTSIVEREGHLGPGQFGFRKNKSTTDAVFVLSTILQKARAKGWPFACAFVDISKVVEVHKLIA